MSARDFRTLSERLTQALLQGDFDLYQQVMTLPLRIEPRGGKPYVLETEDALREDFELYVQVNKLHGVTDMVRDILEIETPDQTKMNVTCLVNLLCGTGRAVDPFQSTMRLRRLPEGWRVYRIESVLGHINWTLGKGGIEDGSFT